MLSLDVLGVVCGYAVCGVASAGATPVVMFNFTDVFTSEEGKFRGGCYAVACAPDGKIWCGDYGGVQLFTSSGQFIRRITDENLKGWCRASRVILTAKCSFR